MCSAYDQHRPHPPTPDDHHVIPQAWQRHWQPPGAIFTTTAAGVVSPLWDRRTVTLCPNCHRGVHERIVALMRDGAEAGHDHLWPVAVLALERFTQAGGSLDDLRAAGLYGEQ